MIRKMFPLIAKGSAHGICSVHWPKRRPPAVNGEQCPEPNQGFAREVAERLEVQPALPQTGGVYVWFWKRCHLADDNSFVLSPAMYGYVFTLFRVFDAW